MHIHTIQLNIEKLIGGTAHMDAAEFGAYMALIVCCYQKKNQLPDDDKRLARMAKCSPRVWARVRAAVSEKFKITDGYWTHNEVGNQLDKYQKLSRKNKSNALKKNKLQKPMAKPDKNQTAANTSNNHQSPDIDTNVSISRSRELAACLLMPDGRFLSPDQFCQEMWQAYPSVGRRKGHLGKFTEQIKKALKGGESHETIIAGVTAYAKYCHATGQLNKDAERWARDAEWRGDYQIGSPAHRPQQGGQSRQGSGGLAQVIDAGEKAKEMLRRADEA